MENKFIPQGIEIVTLAINEDNNKNYEQALVLYKKALEYLMVGVKCMWLDQCSQKDQTFYAVFP